MDTQERAEALSTRLKKDITERLKLARIKAGFKTAKDFALRNQLPVSTYTLHEQGMRGMSLDVLTRYALMLDINIHWLLSGTSSQTAKLD